VAGEAVVVASVGSRRAVLRRRCYGRATTAPTVPWGGAGFGGWLRGWLGGGAQVKGGGGGRWSSDEAA